MNGEHQMARMDAPRRPTFEVVHTGPHAFHARLRAANGEVVWVTESLTRRRAALAAIDLLTDAAVGEAANPGRIRYVEERGL